MSDAEREQRLKELLPQMNTNQMRYLAIRGECATDKEAADMLGLTPQTIYSWPETVKEALALMMFDGVLVAGEILRRNLPKAAAVKVSGLDSEDERIRQASSSEVLDRGLGRPTQHTDITSAGEAIQVVSVGIDVDKL